MRALFALTLAASLVLAQSDADKTIRIEGQVVSTTGEPVRKATLRLAPMNMQSVVRAQSQGMQLPNSTAETTDDAGRFSFDNLTPGSFVLSAERNGYLPQQYGARAVNGAGTAIELKEGDRLSGLIIQMTPHAVIAGRVVDQDGDPLVNVQVRAQRFSYQGGQRQLRNEGTGGLTDDLGNYRISGLVPGRYYVIAERPASPVNTAATYFPNSPDVRGAASVVLRAGSEQGGTTIRMRREKLFTIRGVVMNGVANQPEPGSVVYNMPADIPMMGGSVSSSGGLVLQVAQSSLFPRQIPVDKDGRFTLREMPTGVYTLFASRGGGIGYTTGPGGDVVVVIGSARGGEMPASARADVSLGSQDLDVVLTLGAGATVDGRFVLEEGSFEELMNRTANPSNTTIPVAMLPSGAFAFRLQSIQGISVNLPSSQVKPDGTFKLVGAMPAKYYTLATGIPQGYYIKSMRFGGQDVTRVPLDLSSGGGGEITVLLGKGTGEVSGTLADSQGRPLSGVNVSLWPRVPNESMSSGGVKIATTDQKGAFKFTNVAPGDYAAAAFEDLPDAGLAQYPGFLATAEAASVKLEPNGSVTSTVKLISRDKAAAEIAKLP